MHPRRVSALLILIILLAIGGILFGHSATATGPQSLSVYIPLVQSAPAPLNRYLGLFTIGEPNDYDLYIARSDGSDSRQLTTKMNPVETQWSPDTNQILFRTTAEVGDELWLMNNDGTNLRPIPVATGTFSSPAWSPTGRQISYISQVNQSDTLSVVDSLSGASLWSVTYPTIVPQWAPDGSYLALTAVLTTTTPTQSHIVTINADGTALTQLTAGANDYDLVGWMQGGTRLLVLRTNIQTQVRNLMVLNPDGSNPTVLTAVNGIASPATIAPDGSQFAYLASTDSGLFLQTYRLGASAPIKVSPTICGALPCQVGPVRWSPDSAWLTFGSYSGACPACAVYLTRANGTALPTPNDPLFTGSKDTLWLDNTKVTVQQDNGANSTVNPVVINPATGEVIAEVLPQVDAKIFINGWKYAP